MEQIFNSFAVTIAVSIFCIAALVGSYCVAYHGFKWLTLSYGYAGQAAGYATITIELEAIDRHFTRMMMGIYAILLCMIYYVILDSNR